MRGARRRGHKNFHTHAKCRKCNCRIEGTRWQNSIIQVTANGSQSWDITIPQAIRESSLEWRVIVEGDGLNNINLVSLTSSEPTFESNNLPIILQGIGVALMGAAFVTFFIGGLEVRNRLPKNMNKLSC